MNLQIDNTDCELIVRLPIQARWSKVEEGICKVKTSGAKAKGSRVIGCQKVSMAKREFLKMEE